MTEKQFRKEMRALSKQIHDPESRNQLYHAAKRLAQKETSYEPLGSVRSFLWNRLLGEGEE